MQRTTMTAKKARHPFIRYHFLVSSLLMLLLTVAGFSDNLFTDIGQKSNSDPKFIIHGLFCFAWMIILVIQSNYISKGNYKAHMRLGLAGMASALGVFLTTVYIFVVIYKGWDAMPFYVKANRFFMLSFAVFVWLGYVNRKHGIKHKRYIYMASLYMLGPVLDRVAGHLHIDNVDLFNGIIWNSLFAALFVYDWMTLKKIHRISWVGFLWFYLIWVLSFIL